MEVRIEPTKQVAVGQLPNAPQAPAQNMAAPDPSTWQQSSAYKAYAADQLAAHQAQNALPTEVARVAAMNAPAPARQQAQQNVGPAFNDSSKAYDSGYKAATANVGEWFRDSSNSFALTYKSNAGAVSTNGTRKIGRAVSTTSLLII